MFGKKNHTNCLNILIIIRDTKDTLDLLICDEAHRIREWCQQISKENN
jgi:Rad3-related DNA helicase